MFVSLTEQEVILKVPDGNLFGSDVVLDMDKDHAPHRLLLALVSVELNCETVAAWIPDVDDWRGFLALCNRHRVMALVAKRLLTIPELPPHVTEMLRHERTAALFLSLQQVAEVRRLVRLLDRNGIACVVLKGVPLSIHAFGDLASREARDIDLLVDPATLSSAVAVLENSGLELEKPRRLSRWARAIYLRYSHEYVLRTPSKLTVELKARMHPTARLMPGRVSDVLKRRVTENVGGSDIPTIAHDEALLYLCCHGARHLWFRHKWLVDIAYLIHRMSSKALSRAVDEAYKAGVEVPVLEAFVMAHEWLGAAVPDEILDRGRAHPLVQRRRPMILTAIREQAVEVLRNPPVGHAMERSEYLLRRDWSYRFAVLERHLMVRLHGLVKAMRVSL